MKIKTTQLIPFILDLLSALPPDSKFCQKVKNFAETTPAEDAGPVDIGSKEEFDLMVSELVNKFGDEIETEEIITEWQKQIFNL